MGDSDAAKQTLASMDGGWGMIRDSFKALVGA
jgi:hypothetical protein